MKTRYFKLLLAVIVIQLFGLFLLLSSHGILAKIIEYSIKDILEPPGRSLMLGSSSMLRLDPQKYLLCGEWLNRGIGGSSIRDIDLYLSLTPLYEDPPMVLIYAGENDVSNGEHYSSVLSAYKELINKLYYRFPKTELHIIGIKPSPKRDGHRDQFNAINREMANYTATLNNAYFHPFPEDSGGHEKVLFHQDGIHLTHHGYVAFTSGMNRKCRNR